MERLKEVFEQLEEKPTGSHCNGMEGVIEEGADALEKDEEGASFDSGLIGAALRTEHYEIAGYQASIAMAKTLAWRRSFRCLTANLKEETAAAEKITAAAQPFWPRAQKSQRLPKSRCQAKKSILLKRAARTRRRRHPTSRSAHPRIQKP